MLDWTPQSLRADLGDAAARWVEAIARKHADAGEFSPPIMRDETYQAQLLSSAMESVYFEQHAKRTARNARAKERANA